MGIAGRSYAPRGFSPTLVPPAVKWLLISNVAVFIANFFADMAGLSWLFRMGALVPVKVIPGLQIWELVTYLFIHGDLWHIIFNMLTLYMFGVELERTWGTRAFLKFYFLCGIGAGLCVVAGNYLFGNPLVPTIGSSGAIYGLLLAFGMLWPNRQILFSFLFPIPAKYFVMIVGAIAFLSTFSSAGGGGVSHVAHLGGMIFGYLYLKGSRGKSWKMPLVDWAGETYRDWKMARAKRRFDVYLRKNKRS